MKFLLRILLVIVMGSVAFPVTAGEFHGISPESTQTPPIHDSIILTTKPIKSIKEGNKRNDIFPAKRDAKELDYAWATGAAMGEECMVIIWIRGGREDKRIVYKATKENNLCIVYIPRADFEKQFKYCTLSGIKSDSDKGFVASFGGGPAGGRDDYFFEWGDPSYVRPDFYCILK